MIPKNPEKRKKWILTVLLVTAILFPVLGITLKNYTTNLLDEIKNKRSREITLINRNKVLLNKVKRLRSSDRLKSYAARELNMYNPEPESLSIIIKKQYLSDEE
ncbi:MAG TPA: hypothetical protein VKP78_07705 [bacterium]|nr:hypothetical protein [bacterium]